MPHRAGYFVLAYSWDHHCERLVSSLRERFDATERRLEAIAHRRARTQAGLRDYYREWHDNNVLYNRTLDEISRREFVINSLGYRGYGVNRDLLGALISLRNEYADRLHKQFVKQFHRNVPLLKRFIELDPECVASLESTRLLSELCRRPGEKLPHAAAAARAGSLAFESYWRVMSTETASGTNAAIFQKLFLSMGTSSATIMTGKTGLTNGRPVEEVKQLVNRNLSNVCGEIFANLDTFNELTLDLFKWLHKGLANHIDPDPGNFRSIDFPDRNGVTFEFGNFHREIRDFAIVLKETEQSFSNLDQFLYNLARSYYMFIGIHPFWDSNGRVGRSFLNWMLLKKGLPPIGFRGDEEVLCLPRYGGSMEDMHEYLNRRLVKAVQAYFRERQNLQSFGVLEKPLYNASFDSGFFFRQIENDRPYLQVKFDVFVAKNSAEADSLRDTCRVVLPDEDALHSLAVYCGLGSYAGSWECSCRIGKNLTVEEIDSDIPGVRSFEVGFIFDIGGQKNGLNYFSCMVLSDKRGLLFNNAGYNYSYRLMK